MRKVAVSILAAIVMWAAVPTEGSAGRYDKVSFTGILGLAYQDHGDLQSQIDFWNMIMEFAEASDPSFGNAQAEDIGLGYSLLADARRRMSSRFVLALRMEYVTDNSSTLANFLGAEFAASAVPVTLSGLYEFPGLFPGILSKMKINLGAGFGPVMRGVYKLEFMFPVYEHLTARATARGFQMHALAELEYPLLERWGLTAELSYRYTTMGKLTYRSVSGASEAIRLVWEGDGTPQNPGVFVGIPFPEEGNKVVYTTTGDEMELGFSGLNIHLGLRFYAW